MALLTALRTPRTLREIELRAAADDRERTLSRQTVKTHLEKLLGADLVQARPVVRDYGETVAYAVHHQSVYRLSEAVKDLARLRPRIEPQQVTVAHERAAQPALPSGPSLVLVRGLDEGTAFPLAADGAASQWVIGRRRGLAVALDYDPFVSSENAVVAWDGACFTVADIAGSRNGTAVNFDRLEPGEARELAHGDLIGVGESLLLFRS